MRDEALAERIESDWTSAGLDSRRSAMLAFAVKLSRSPAAMARADVESLRAAGFGDRDILDIVQVTAYYAYANRIADGLGIELEPGVE